MGGVSCAEPQTGSTHRNQTQSTWIIDTRILDVSDCRILNQSSTSISIDCRWPGDTPSSPFIFEVFKSDKSSLGDLVANLSVEYPRLVLTNLSSSTDFTVILSSQGSMFPPIKLETFTLEA